MDQVESAFFVKTLYPQAVSVPKAALAIHKALPSSKEVTPEVEAKAGVTVKVTSSVVAAIVKVIFPLVQPVAETVISTLPAATPVTTPAEVTVALVSSEEAKAKVSLTFLPEHFTVRVMLAPTQTLVSAAVTVKIFSATVVEVEVEAAGEEEEVLFPQLNNPTPNRQRAAMEVRVTVILRVFIIITSFIFALIMIC